MKPFNLEEAKAGKPVCTKSGRKARIVCFDARNNQPIVALIEDADNRFEIAYNYDLHGKWDEYEETARDLMMAEDEEPKCPFKPFDKVLARNSDTSLWYIDFFDRYAPEYNRDHFVGFRYAYAQCIPYNEETAHLLGTTDAAPEKYIIW